MKLDFFVTENQAAIPIHVITQQAFPQWLSEQSEFIKKWLLATQFRQEVGNTSLIPDASGTFSMVVCCLADADNFWGTGHLPYLLPEGIYSLVCADVDAERFAIAWGLGAYQFSRYKKSLRHPAKLFLPDFVDVVKITNIVSAIYRVRDCINTPAEDMGPSELAHIVKQVADAAGATTREIVGEDLLTQNYATIYTVGRAGDDAPRLIDFSWGDEKHPKVTLVGKGVCFDTGGLDLKPSAAMLLMKKDMAGAAHVVGLAQMIMAAKLPIKLRVMLPLVENAIAGNAYRPGDIIRSRKGLTIEIGNTDGEGRLVLADALTEAVSDKPELLIDMSTLTGAARVALGTDLPALFSNCDEVANAVIQEGMQVCDFIWRLPLFSLYRDSLNSTIADINNNSTDIYAGAITAALFLKEFVPDTIPWLHFDLMAWNMKTRPGRPQGGEAMAVRALFHYLQKRFSKQ
jgi:leucyl aminopeptidase